MPVADPAFGWEGATIAFCAIVVVGFLVSWLVTDRMGVTRTPYVAILTLAVLVLGGAYLGGSGTTLEDIVTDDWALGVLAGLITAGAVIPMVRRLPAHPHPAGRRLVGAFLWEGVVYGIGEGILLATLPVLAVWQATDDLGWTEGTWAKVGAGAMAIAGALVVIAIHHLGYAEFRRPAARPKLVGALVGCGLQALAFLLTGNVLAPIVAHVVLHWGLILRGSEMPPAPEVAPALGHAA
jgi:hypothetical protein